MGNTYEYTVAMTTSLPQLNQNIVYGHLQSED